MELKSKLERKKGVEKEERKENKECADIKPH